ncbi:MAG: hypothetical protein KDB11_01650, partial [Planctomycetales bacterium]|nr:hypothetical protein [Planctomycetales bacterium]
MFRTIIDRLLKRERSNSRKLSRSQRRDAFLHALRSRTAVEVATWTSVFRNIVKHETRKRAASFQTYLMPALQMEALELRLLLTANLFIDYGDNFPGGILSTTQGAFRDIANTSGGDNPILGVELGDTTGFNAGVGLNIVAQSYTATDRAEALAIVQRAYAGLDINVIELTNVDQTTPDGRTVQGAANMNDVINTLRGGNASWKDAYIFVGTFIADPGGSNQKTYGGTGGGLSPSTNGFGETADLFSASNLHDDVGVVYDTGSNFSTNTINNIAHEAGHDFGLQHGITNAITTNNDNSVTPGAVNLLHEADIMSYRNTNNTTSSVAFTRYPVIRGDGNSPGSGVLGSYDDLSARMGYNTNHDQLANDANVGAKPNVTFVSGTGAHDRITLTRNGANVDVTIEAFEESALTTSIEVPGAGGVLNGASYNYSFPVSSDTILIQSGGSNDDIIINGDLGMDVLIDGMLGTDDLTVVAPGAVHTPNGAPTASVDLDGGGVPIQDYGGVVTMGAHTITYNNFEPASTFSVTNTTTVIQLTGTVTPFEDGNTDTFTISNFTVPAGTDRLLVVSTAYRDANNDIASVTFDGHLLTKGSHADGGSGDDAQIWYIPLDTVTNPIGTITGDIVASAGIGNNIAQFVMGASVFGGVDQANPVDGPKQETDTDLSIMVTSEPGDLVIDAIKTSAGAGGDLTVNGSQTLLFNEMDIFGSDFEDGASSTKPGAASVTMSWTHANTVMFSAHAGLNINAEHVVMQSMIDGNGDLVLDEAGAGTDEGLTISYDGTNYTFTLSSGTFMSTNTNVLTVPVASITGDEIIINTGDGDDTLTVDLGGTALDRIIRYNGGESTGDNDEIQIINGGATTITYTPAAPGVTADASGGFDIDGQTITFTGLEPALVSTPATNVVVDLSSLGAGEAVTIADSGGNDGMFDINFATNTLEDVTVANPSGTLQIIGSGFVDSVTFSSIDAAFAAAIDIDLGAGAAEVISLNVATGIAATTLDLTAETIQQTGPVSATGTTTLDAGATGTINLTSATNDFQGALTITNAATADIVDANSLSIDSVTTATSFFAQALNGSITDATAGEGANISSPSVALRATTGIGDAAVDDSDIDLAATNVSATTVTGDISLSDSDGLTVATVDSLSGVTITTGGAGDDILIREGTGSGNLSINQVVTNAGAGNITLSSDEGTAAAVGNVNVDASVTSQGGNVLIVANNNANFLLTVVPATQINISTTGTGTVGIHAGRKVSFAGALSNGASGGDITTPTGGNVRDYTVSSGTGNITMTAPDLVQLDRVTTGGTVIITADRDGNGSGSIEDRFSGEDAAGENVVATSLAIRAGNGIGSAATDTADIDIQVTNLAATTATGDISISDTGALDITTVDTLPGVGITSNAATGNILIRDGVGGGAESVRILQAINNAGSGNVTVFANGDNFSDELQVQAGVTATGGNVLLVSFGDLRWVNTPTVSTTGAGTIGVHGGATLTYPSTVNDAGGAGGSFLNTNLQQFNIQSGGGNITLNSTSDVDVSAVNAGAGTVFINADTDASGGGAVFDVLPGDGAGNVNIIAAAAVLQAAGGVGTNGNPLDTQLAQLDVSNTTSGVIRIDNIGALQLTNLGGPNTRAVSGVGGGGRIVATSPLTISSDAITSGGFTYTATDDNMDGGGVGMESDDLTIQTGVTVQDTTAALTLNGGDQVLIQGTANVSGATTITINVDNAAGPGDADLNTPGTVTIANTATITSTNGTAINGGDDVNGSNVGDTFNLAPRTTTSFTIDGAAPSFPTANPADTLNIDLSAVAITGETLHVTGPGAGFFAFTSAHLAVNYGDIETVNESSGTPFDLVVDMQNDIAVDDNAAADDDEIIVRLNATDPTILEILIDVDDDGTEELHFSGPIADVNSLTVIGSNQDNDMLHIDESNGRPVFQGTVPGVSDNLLLPGMASIFFSGGAAGNDSLMFTLDNTVTGIANTNQTYAIGDGAGDGVDSDGEILTVDTVDNTIAHQIYFTGLEPITTSGVAGGTLTILGDGAANIIEVIDADAVAGPAGFTRVRETAGFETFDFAADAFTALEVYGMGGSDTIDLRSLDVNEDTLTAVRLDGDSNVGGDNSDDEIRVRSTTSLAVTSTVSLFGGAGGDTFVLDSTPADGAATGTVDNITSLIAVSPTGDEGGTDLLRIVDTDDATGDTVRVTSTTIGEPGANGITGNNNGTTADITYGAGDQIETINIFTSNTGGDTVNIRSTLSGSVYNIATQAGGDTVNIASNAPTLLAGAGNLNAIDGAITLDTGAGTDTLNISDFDDTTGDTYSLTQAGPGEQTTVNWVDGFAGVEVTYNSNSLGTNAGNNGTLENLNLTGANPLTSNNTYNIFHTTATIQTTISDGDATVTGAGNNGTFEIDANQLQPGAANTFNGFDGNDTFNVDYNNAGGGATGGTFVISGGANNAPLSNNRDLININNITGIRNATFSYQAGAGEVDVDGLGTTLDADTVEQINYNADVANNDTVVVNGRNGTADDLTVAPITASRALVFLDGDPWDGPNEGDLFDQFPGVAGGSNGPDIDINGVSAAAGALTIQGNTTPTATEDDQVYIYAPNEAPLTDAAGNTTTLNPFGFGVGVIIPGFGGGTSFDAIDISNPGAVTRTQITSDRNGAATNLLAVDMTRANGFGQTNPLEPGLVVSTGFEVTPFVSATDQRADATTVTPSPDYFIQVNGGRPFDPGDVTAPVGDRIILNYPNGVNVYSDQASPPNVSTVGIGAAFGITFSSMEDVLIDTPTANIVGDDNGNAPGQHDEYLITGIADFDPDGGGPGPNDGIQNDFTLQINDSSPITFLDVSNLNVYGTTLPGAPDENTAGSGNDRVAIQPYATNLAEWQVDVQVNLQDGDDRVAYTGVLNILDDILVDADFADAGEGRIFDDNVMGTVSGVAINFANTENVNVNANPNDGDLLTIRTTTQDDQVLLRFDPDRTGGRTGVDAGTNTLGVPNDTRDDDIRIANHFDVVIDDGRGVHNLASLAATVTTPLDATVVNGFGAVVLDLQEGDDTVTIDVVAAFDDSEVAANDTANDAIGGGAGTLPLNVTILAGPPNASDMLVVNGNQDANDGFAYTPGADSQSGTIVISGTDTGEVSFSGVEDISLNGGGSTAGNTSADTLTLNGTGGNDVFTLNAVQVANAPGGTAQVNDGPAITFASFGVTFDTGAATSSVTLTGGDGDDVFNVTHASAWQMLNVNVDGGTPSASDEFNLLGTNGDGTAPPSLPDGIDTFTYTPTSENAATLNLNSDGVTTNYLLTNVEAASIDGLGQDGTSVDTLTSTLAHSQITPDPFVLGRGTLTAQDAVGGNPLLPLSYDGIENPVVSGNTVVVLGSELNDVITVGFEDLDNDTMFDEVAVRVNGNLLDVTGYPNLVLNGLGGDDVIRIAPDLGKTVTVVGGGSNDTLVLDTLLSAATPTYNYVAGPSILTPGPKNGVLSDAGTGTTVEYLGVEAVHLALNAGNGDQVTVRDDAGDNTWSIGAGEPVGGIPTVRVAIDDRSPLSIQDVDALVFENREGGTDHFIVSANQLTNASTYTFTGLGATSADILEVVGSGGQEAFEVTDTTVDSGPSPTLTYGSFGTVVLDGLGDDDTFTVTANTALVSTPVHVVGGSGFDTLRIQGTVAGVTDTTYTPGLGLSDGQLDYDAGAMSITFTGLEPVQDALASTNLTVNGTPGNNAISYSAGANAGLGIFGAVTNTGLVSVDGFETIEFANKVNLIINTGAGSDSVSINNSSLPDGIVAATSTITVNNGDPTASDTLTVNSQSAVNDTMVVLPSATTQGAGTVDFTGNNLPDVVYTGAEHINLVGQLAEGDTFGVDGTAGNDVFEYFSGETIDSGRILGTMNLGAGAGISLPEIAFSNMNPGVVRAFNVQGAQGGNDTFLFVATDSDDTIVYDGSSALTNGQGAVVIANIDIGTANSGIAAGNTNVLIIQSNDGADNITVTGEANVLIDVRGGQPDSGSDTLTYNAAGDVRSRLTANNISDAGVAGDPDVVYSGIERLVIEAAGNTVRVEGNAFDEDAFTVRPNDAMGAEVTIAGTDTVLQVNNSDTAGIEIDGNDGAGFANSLLVIGTDAGETIDVDVTTVPNVSVGSRLPVNIIDIQSLAIDGGDGNDTFNVTPGDWPVLIDGGDPIGMGDTLNLTPAGAPIFTPGPESDEGDFAVTGAQPVSFDHIEAVTVDLAGAAGLATIMGTGDDDHITATGTAMDEVAVQVNDGPIVTYANAVNLTLQGKNGDDDIVIDAALAGAGVAFTVEGGSSTNGSDTLTVYSIAGAADNLTLA